MPIFEYQCEDCGQVNEFLMPKAADTPKKLKLACANCKSHRLKRIISTIAVHSSGKTSSCPTGTCQLQQ